MIKSKQIKIGSSIIVAFGLLLAAGLSSVHAVEPTSTTTETTIRSETSTTEEKPKTTIQERLERRKTVLQLKLTAAQQTKLKGRCRAAQAKLGTINDRAIEVRNNRLKAYSNLEERLNSLVTKVGDKADTTQLQAEIVILGGKVTVVEDALTSYRQAISDLVEIDCVADPEGFKASLEYARTLQNTLKTASADLRNYVKDTIKPTLKTIRAALVAQAENEAN